MRILKITFITLGLAAILILPYLSFANNTDGDTGIYQTCPPKVDGTPMSLQECQKYTLGKIGEKSYGQTFTGEQAEKTLAFKVGQVAGMALSVFGVVFLCLVVYSGIEWMTAGGNEEKVSKARQRIMRAAIGLGIIMMAYALTTFIVTKLQGTSSQEVDPGQPTPQSCQDAGGQCFPQCPEGWQEVNNPCPNPELPKCCRELM